MVGKACPKDHDRDRTKPGPSRSRPRFGPTRRIEITTAIRPKPAHDDPDRDRETTQIEIEKRPRSNLADDNIKVRGHLLGGAPGHAYNCGTRLPVPSRVAAAAFKLPAVQEARRSGFPGGPKLGVSGLILRAGPDERATSARRGSGRRLLLKRDWVTPFGGFGMLGPSAVACHRARCPWRSTLAM
jgi:hypothetical protein